MTNRDFENGFEAIEWDAQRRQFFWYAEERAMVACFPCDVEFARETFAKCGRTLDVTKLPNWPVPLPWWRRLANALLSAARKFQGLQTATERY